MDKDGCKSCGMHKVCRDSNVSWVFFFVGLVATIALRIIEPIRFVDPLYAKVSWYVGVSGFFLFFVYKYRILKERSKLIKNTGLSDKIMSSSKLSGDDYTLLEEIVCSQDNWKERMNFLAIFALSAAALIVALWFDLAR